MGNPSSHTDLDTASMCRNSGGSHYSLHFKEKEKDKGEKKTSASSANTTK